MSLFPCTLTFNSKAGVVGFGLGKIKPTRGDQREETVSACLLSVLSASSIYSVLLQVLHTQIDLQKQPSSLQPACLCLSYDLAELNHAYVRTSAGMCSRRVFGSFLNTASPKHPLGDVVLTPPLCSPPASFNSRSDNYISPVSGMHRSFFYFLFPPSLSILFSDSSSRLVLPSWSNDTIF